MRTCPAPASGVGTSTTAKARVETVIWPALMQSFLLLG